MARYLGTSSKPYRLVAICLMAALLLACGDKDSTPAAVVDQQSSPSPVSSSDTTPTASASQPASQVVAQLPSYAPSHHDVRLAFRNALFQQANQMAPSAQREEWVAQEINRINAIQVGKCETVPVGTASECYLSISGQSIKLKFLLTQSGWVIVG